MAINKSIPLALALSMAIAGCANVEPKSSAENAVGQPAANASQPVIDKAAQLSKLYEEFWEETLKMNPLRATSQGDNR